MNVHLDQKRIFSPSSARLIGREGEVLKCVDSTMDVAFRRMAEGRDDGYVVVAESQRDGRGRKGEWVCPAGKGILMSVVLTMGVQKKDQMLIGLLGAVSASEAVAHFGVDAGIKWPNDIVVEGKNSPDTMKKLGGVLVEQKLRGDAAPAHVLGIGININQNSSELPMHLKGGSTSMKIELKNREISRNAVCRYLMERLDHWYGKMKLGHREALLARWRTLSCLIGRQIEAEDGGERLVGKIIGLRSSGELIMRLRDGRKHFLSPERAQLIL